MGKELLSSSESNITLGGYGFILQGGRTSSFVVEKEATFKIKRETSPYLNSAPLPHQKVLLPTPNV